MADIKNNHFKGKIRDNGLDADIKDISVGNQDVFNNLSFTGYSLTQEIPVAGKILRSDGSDIIKWDDDIRVVNTTYTDLTNLINNSGLYPGSIYRFRYYIAGNTFHPASYFDIYLQALTTNTISEDGIRVMRVPRRSYLYKSFVSKGFWEPSETYAIGDLAVFAGRVYENRTGNTGSISYDIMLDRTNWTEKQNTNPGDFSFITASRVYYQEKVFKIRYDFSKKLVVEQRDELGNTVTGIKDPQRRLDTFQNTIELNDWNYPRIFNNTSQGIWGNQTQIISNSTFGDFDYAVIKYIWTTGNGTDLDTRTATVDLPDSTYNQVDIGWGRYANGSMPTGGYYVGPSTSNYYLWWSDDFTGSAGNESVLVNFINLESTYPTLQELSIRMRAFWYGNRINGDMQLNITTYKGGTMSKSGYNFINTGGTLVSNITETYNMGLAASANIDGEEIGTLTFDFATNTGFSLINNISEAYIKENNIPGTIHLNNNRRDDEVLPAAYKSIKYNTNKGSIYSNTNKGNIEYNDNLGAINSNTGDYQYLIDPEDNPIIGAINGITEIEYNSNHGNISSNVLSGLGKISYNSNHGNISSNSIIIGQALFSAIEVPIYYNINGGDISSNSYSFNGGDIFSSSTGIRHNSNKGSISSNTINYIGYNSNRGTISSNNPKVIGGFGGSNYGLISSNSNNGNITGNTLYAIESNSNDGFITNNTDPGSFTQFRINEVTEGDNITGLSLSSNYTGYNFPQLIGTVDYILKSDGTNAVWAVAPGGGTVSGTGASPQVALWTATSTIGGSSRITYADTPGSDVSINFYDGGYGGSYGAGLADIYTEDGPVSVRIRNGALATTTGPLIQFFRSKGNMGSTSPLTSGYVLGELDFFGTYDTLGSYNGSAAIRVEASQTWTNIANGTKVSIVTMANGEYTGLTERFAVIGTGAIRFNNAYTFPMTTGSNGQVLTTNGSGTLSWTTVSGGGGGVSGSGTTDYVARWTPDGTTLGIGLLRDNNTTVVVNGNPSSYSTSRFVIEETAHNKTGLSINYTVTATGSYVTNVGASITTTASSGQNGNLTALQLRTSNSRSLNEGLNIGVQGSSSMGYPSQVGINILIGTAPTMQGTNISNFGIYSSISEQTSTSDSVGIYSLVSPVTGGGSRYATQLRDGTEGLGKFLKSVTNAGKANWAPITGADITGGTNGRLAIWGTTLTDNSAFNYEIGSNQSSIIVGTPYSNAVYVSDNGEVSIWKNNTTTSFSNGATLNLYTFGSDVNYTSKILLKRNRGTAASTSVILSGDEIGQIQFGPYEGASIRVYATENRLGVNDDTGTSLVIRTVSNGTTNTSAERFRIEGDGAIKVTGQMYSALPANLVPTGTTQTINWNSANGQTLSLASSTGNVTVTLTNPKSGGVYVLKIIQHATSFKNIVWPASVKWSGGVLPTISAVANAVDTVVLFYDGTNYYANISQNYA